MSQREFDVIVVGGGHAGAEAAWAAAQLGARTAMVTFQRDAIGRMSCNPAIGGIGKGQMVRELDALGGLMGIVADDTGIQFRMLNRRKGPAVWAPRCQSDSAVYARAVRERLERCPNLEIVEAAVDGLEAEPCGGDGVAAPAAQIRGVRLGDGTSLTARAVVVTSGTFLRALMHRGTEQTAGGRIGEQSAVGLSASLAALGFQLGRLKTGTPPRLRRDTIDFVALDRQPGDDEPAPFSFLHERIAQPQVDCWITWTNEAAHALIRDNLHLAPMYSGQIQSTGPRYCPSIEDKVVRFAEKSAHQLFLEPEGRDSERIYVNGISTSLPVDVQRGILAQIPGLARAEVLQWGYAVEYDFVPPEQIDATMMTKRVRGLFLAGQICGTSGYEEAAGQGLVAGVNAARHVGGREPFTLRRDQAYIGVMIDDLVTRGVDEPYRMFTSRAEHRMHLRYDNADERLTPVGRGLGLVDDARWARFEAKQRRIDAGRELLTASRLAGRSLAERLRSEDEDVAALEVAFPAVAALRADREVWDRLLVEIRYAGYIERQERMIATTAAMESRPIPAEIEYGDILHLRTEARQRWSAVRPRTVGQASRVPGIHPTDVSQLLVYLGRGRPGGLSAGARQPA